MIPFRYKGASHCKLIFDDVSVILKFLISDGTIVWTDISEIMESMEELNLKKV